MCQFARRIESDLGIMPAFWTTGILFHSGGGLARHFEGGVNSSTGANTCLIPQHALRVPKDEQEEGDGGQARKQVENEVAEVGIAVGCNMVKTCP